MITSRIIYILISIIVLAIIAVVVILRIRKKEQKPLSTLAALAFSLIIAGIVFVDNRLISYSLFGAAVILSFIDIVKKSKK